MKKVIFLMTFVVVTLMVVGVVSATTYEIYNWDDLQNMQNDLNGDYSLMNDLDESTPGYATYQSGAGFDPVGTFTGTFDGQGHVITGLYINRPEGNGLFSQITNATISNVGLVDINIISGTGGKNDVGSLVGKMNSGTIENCYATGSLTNGYYRIGGLVGKAAAGTIIKNCYADVSITADNPGGCQRQGGLVGDSYGTIENCYATGDLNCGCNTGGLVGWRNSGTISNCYCSGHSPCIGYISGGTGSADYVAESTFYSKENEPLASWDFENIWKEVSGDFPIFISAVVPPPGGTVIIIE